jgi:protein-S-isoprenylcysteine O-methyltransferase Ste14
MTALPSPHIVIAALWSGWAVSWLAAAVWASQAEKRAALGAEIAYRIPLILGGILFFVPAHGYQGLLRLWHVNLIEAWICTALIAVGFIFCWWARIYLGRLWSGSVTKKTDHRIVDTGPYALVRHPIYTGLLLAVFATMAAKGTVYGVAGAAIITVGIWMKARLEEKFLRRELGAAAYDAYARRAPMLIPFIGT